MPSRHFLEPSTPASLANARERLESDNAAVQSLTGSIAAAEAALKKMVEEQRALIQALRDERTALEEDIKHIKGYVAPIRRLPHELVRAIIQLSCEDSSRDDSAWVIAAVCSTWRRLALNMPRLWSKIRLVTSPTASPDSIRLWLERSGTNEPLDIEITVQVQRGSTSTSSSSRPRWRTASLWGSHAHTYIQPVHYVQIHGGAQGTSVQTIPFHAALATLPPPSPLFNESWPPPATASVGLPPSPSMSATSKSRVSTHWGHVAFFYLVQQMYRWKRFVFRFDKPFPSYAAALQSIEGSAPLLEEFEIACAEPTFDHDSWVWLPTTNAASSLPSLRSVTLKHAPFKWNAPMLRNNLRSLSLHAYGPTATALDRLLQIVTANRSLAELNLNFSQVALPVLPLSTATLPELVTLSVGGHHALATLVDRLIVPALESLSLDFEPRDPLDECVTSLLTRSAHPPVTLLALGYGSPHGPGPSYLYHAGGLVTSWAFLADLPHLRTLRVGGAALDVLFATLASCEDDAWMCPRLTSVALRCCSAQIDAVMKLVRAVEARNPAEGMTAPAGAPAKFKSLSMSECGGIGEDVVEWLRARVEEVVFVEPSSDRWLAV